MDQYGMTICGGCGAQFRRASEWQMAVLEGHICEGEEGEE